MAVTKFKVGDLVEKHIGDYHAKGEVRAIFTMSHGAVRYVVEHQAADNDRFCLIYPKRSLRLLESRPAED